MAHAYPLMLDISARQIVIIGGGAVAVRKVTGLHESGATRIRVISPEFRVAFPPGIELIQRPYQPGDLKDAGLVFAATDSATINDAVMRDAHSLGILANRADSSKSEPGDFVIPARYISGPITVTVSAGSAALSAWIAYELKGRFDPAWSAMADAMKELRPLIKSMGMDAARRAELFRALTTPAAFDALREKGVDGLKAWISKL